MLNWMLYFRGHSKDFDEWEDLGNPGWGWRNVQAFFKKAEKFAGSNEDRTYGTEGRFWVMPLPHVHEVIYFSMTVLGPKLLLVMGCVKLGEKNCVQLPSVGEQNAN